MKQYVKTEGPLCDAKGNLAAEQKQCKCSLRTALVGDGCSVCNPTLAQEHAFMAASDRAAEAEAERDRWKAIAGELAEALEMMCEMVEFNGFGKQAAMQLGKAARAKYEQEKGV